MTTAVVPEPCEIASFANPNPATPTQGAPPDPSPPTTRIRRVKTTHSVGQTLAPITPAWRRRVRAAYRQMGGAFRPLNDHRRAQLSEAIFQVENDLEHRSPNHPQVVALRTVRNRLSDDLGWNEYPSNP